MEQLLNKIEDVKENLTSQDYKELIEALGKARANVGLYEFEIMYPKVTNDGWNECMGSYCLSTKIERTTIISSGGEIEEYLDGEWHRFDLRANLDKMPKHFSDLLYELTATDQYVFERPKWEEDDVDMKPVVVANAFVELKAKKL